MIKVIELFRYNPAVSREQQDAHYLDFTTRNINLPSLRQMPGLVAYRQCRVLEARKHDFNNPVAVPLEPEFHRIAEMVFEDRAAMERNFLTDPEVLRPIYADHVNFMETNVPGSLKIYVMEEVEVSVR